VATWVATSVSHSVFYDVISFEEGGSPDWDSMERLSSKHARITRVTPEAIDHLDLKGFRSMAEEMIEVGAFTSFFEREIARRVGSFGGVIHWSPPPPGAAVADLPGAVRFAARRLPGRRALAKAWILLLRLRVPRRPDEPPWAAFHGHAPQRPDGYRAVRDRARRMPEPRAQRVR
jgi:hypothetical protein